MVLSIVSLLSTMCTLVYIHAVGGKSVVSDCYKSYERIRGWKSTSTLQRVPLVSYVVCVTRVPVMGDDRGNVAKVLLFGSVSFCSYDTLLFFRCDCFFLMEPHVPF